MGEDQTALLREAYAALEAGEVDRAVSMMNPAIEWHEPGLRGYPPPGGDRIYLGPASVARNVLVALAATWDDIRLIPEEFLSNGERVAVVGRFSGKAKETGRTVEAPFVHVWTIREGTLCRFQDYTDTAKILHALGAVTTP